MKKDLAFIGGLFLVLAILLIFGGGFTTLGLVNRRGLAPSSTRSALPDGVLRVKIKTLDVNATVAASSEDQKKGLGKRESMPLNEGLIFVFDSVGPYSFWMKDMRFAIDIIWLDENKKVVDLVANAPAQPGKSDRDLTLYKPRTDAKYVLEVNAGLSSLNNIAVGDLAEF